MKALTLHQPWATLIALGLKTAETRVWSPPKDQLGQRLAIHAGRRTAPETELHTETEQAMTRQMGPSWRKIVPTGAVVSTATLAGALRVEQQLDDSTVLASHVHGLSTQQVVVRADMHGDFSAGRILWMLEDVQVLDPPAPAAGQIKLWNWTPPPDRE